jgi:hypothetical protein
MNMTEKKVILYYKSGVVGLLSLFGCLNLRSCEEELYEIDMKQRTRRKIKQAIKE